MTYLSCIARQSHGKSSGRCKPHKMCWTRIPCICLGLAVRAALVLCCGGLASHRSRTAAGGGHDGGSTAQQPPYFLCHEQATAAADTSKIASAGTARAGVLSSRPPPPPRQRHRRRPQPRARRREEPHDLRLAHAPELQMVVVRGHPAAPLRGKRCGKLSSVGGSGGSALLRNLRRNAGSWRKLQARLKSFLAAPSRRRVHRLNASCAATEAHSAA